ncbi:hypothetical protein D0Z07_4388 [Hyphodiscus hymeniophilus]|uniref:Spindle pole body component n=1 Tax=Hyphodiscus hymeniophilus TaxID=353542 RepID=A0A9P6VJK8_9HELO|nr:hypothetical protein D0Z07_4388 [Hyphodiscus hymeniophilus]
MVPLKSANYQSWDEFEDERVKEPRTAYITEAGPGIFDAAIEADFDSLHVGNRGNPIIEGRIYFSSVLALGLGRSSTLFAWDEVKQCFKPTLPDMRISGHTTQSLDGLLAIFMDCGNTIRFLQNFVDKVYTQSTSSGRVALADAVSTLLTTIQSCLNASAAQTKSLLQLQALFDPAHSILTCFRRLVVNVSATRSDESMLSTVFEEIQLLEHKTGTLGDVLIEVMSRVSRPFLDFTGEWVGLQREAGLPLTKESPSKSFVKVDDKEWIDEQGLESHEKEFVLDYDKVPSFIAADDARSLFEVGRSLRFLRAHHPEHPLSRADVVTSANPPALEWTFSWQDIVVVETKALQFEKDLTAAINRFSDKAFQSSSAALDQDYNAPTFHLNFFGKPEEEMQAHMLASIDTFDQLPNGKSSPDRLSQILSNYFDSSSIAPQEDNSIFSPPISLIPSLSFNPIISAQARIVNGTCMRMFFNSHKLRDHLCLQRDFHLLGNGVFSSRLSHALFDPELESAERYRGVARSGGIMGLRLGGRDTWPPASSELRLALMGVLTESYVSTQSLDDFQAGGYIDRQNTLPGDLSFGVRDMSEDEIDKCMNPDSIEALDFLRLSYKPPPPLEAVITPLILFKYDQLFKFLLRITRMLYVVSALFRDATDRTSFWQGVDFVAQRFRMEAHHFISSVSGYFFDTGIESTWRVFERKLDEIQERINTDDSNIALGETEGLNKLRDYHERVLDKIMFALLLRKRQQPVMQLLEDIFTLVLRFSKHSRQKALGLIRKVGADDEVKEMYLRFRKKVGVFITVCRGLSEKKGYGEKRAMESRFSEQGSLFDGDDLAEENTIVQLLARLEMSNYYSTPVDV